MYRKLVHCTKIVCNSCISFYSHISLFLLLFRFLHKIKLSPTFFIPLLNKIVTLPSSLFLINRENQLFYFKFHSTYFPSFFRLLQSLYPGGENVLFIKNVFCYPNDMNDNALDRKVLGASFEPYSMFLRPAELIQKLK